MTEFIWETPEEINSDLAIRVRQIRRRKKISQKHLSELSGVSLGSVKRFESTGQISLLSLTRISLALGCVNQIKNLFTDIPYSSIEEVINERR